MALLFIAAAASRDGREKLPAAADLAAGNGEIRRIGAHFDEGLSGQP